MTGGEEHQTPRQGKGAVDPTLRIVQEKGAKLLVEDAGVLARPTNAGQRGPGALHDGAAIYIRPRLKGAKLLSQECLRGLQPTK